MTSKRKALSLTIPCYNEAKNIPHLLDRLSGAIMRPDIEVVLVDNGSTDETVGILDKILPDYPFARSIRIEKNIGYGYGVFTGLRQSDSEFVGWTHGDLQTDPKDIIKAFEMLESLPSPQKTYIKGSRIGRPWSDNLFSLGMGLFASVILKMWLYEINAQPNLFHRSLLSRIPTAPNDFSFDLFFYYMAKTNGYDIKRFKVLFENRIFGTSDWNTDLKSRIRFISRTARFTLSLKKRLDTY